MPELVAYYTLPPAGSVGPDTEYPILVPEEDVIRWNWRVKSWRYAYNINFRIDSEAHEFNLSDEDVFVTDVASEIEIPCGPVVLGTILFDTLDIGGGFTATGGLGMQLFGSSFIILSSGTDQYPRLLVQIGFAVPEVAASFSASSTRDAPSDPLTPADATIDTVGVDIYSLGYSDITLLDGTITITPEEYWSYDGVVDTTTGDALIPAQTDVSYYFQCPCP